MMRESSQICTLLKSAALLTVLVAFQSGRAQVTGAAAAQAGAAKADQSLRIGPSDEVEVTVFDALDLSTHGRVDADGNVFVPTIGAVRVIGMTSAEAGQAITEKLQQKGIVNHPQVSVFVKEYTNAEISIGGEVNKPGVYSILGPHRLLDILQTAGGPTEKAGNTVTITHRGSDSPMTVELSKDAAAMATNNVELQPGDTVIVSKAGIVYVLGEVYRPGGYISSSAGGVTVLQVLAAAGGPTRYASAGKTRLLRRTPDGVKETPIPLPKLLAGKVGDMPVQPDDILYIPSSTVKSFVGSSIVAMGSQAAIYRLP
jgi:polysaccharide biosynthesis/export protein